MTTYPMWAEDDGSVTGFMCLTDFECELGGASGGNTVYASITDCKARRKCTDTCGIVEVKVTAVRVVQEPIERL